MATQAAQHRGALVCNISGIEALLIAMQFRWTGHVIRMSNDRLPKIIFYSELKDGVRARGGQRKRYKDTLKANLKRCNIVPADLETLVMERSKWRSLCKTSIQHFGSDRSRSLEAKREHGRQQLPGAPYATYAKSVGKHVRRELGCTPTLVHINIDYDPGSVVSTAQSNSHVHIFNSVEWKSL